MRLRKTYHLKVGSSSFVLRVTKSSLTFLLSTLSSFSAFDTYANEALAGWGTPGFVSPVANLNTNSLSLTGTVSATIAFDFTLDFRDPTIKDLAEQFNIQQMGLLKMDY